MYLKKFCFDFCWVVSQITKPELILHIFILEQISNYHYLKEFEGHQIVDV